MASLRARFSDSLVGVLFYGSALGNRDFDEDGLFDFYAVVDSYRQAYGSRLPALANRALPPNVYYLEVPRPQIAAEPANGDEPSQDYGAHDHLDPSDSLGLETKPSSPSAGFRAWRAKYNVVSQAQLHNYCAPTTLQPYFWGRLSQPTEILWSRDETCRAELQSALSSAQEAMLRAALPLVSAGDFRTSELWERGLQASYETEFRAEKKGQRARSLTAKSLAHYEASTRSLSTALGLRSAAPSGPLEAPDHESTWRLEGPAQNDRWWKRRLQGRVLQILRLMKAASTFDGGIDYLMWKIERHSGVRVEPGPWTRRLPWLFGRYALWKAKRRGGFR